MADGTVRNYFEADSLWDETGRVWHRKQTQWLTKQDVRRFVHRKKRAVLYGVEGESVEWIEPDRVATFWRDIEDRLEVPGQLDAVPATQGDTFGAHVWRSGNDRLLGFQRFC